MKISKYVFTLGFLLFSQSVLAQAKAPSWFDLKSRTKLVEAQAKKDGFAGKLDFQKFETQKLDIGSGKLNLVIAQFGSLAGDEVNGYNLSEISTEAGKVLFQLVDKTGCGSKVIEEANIRKLGFVGDIQVHFAPVKLVQPTCPNSVSTPKIFIVIQESKKGLEKVYESEISENGRYRIAFKKEMIRLDYAKNLNSESKAVELVWNEKTQKFAPESP